MITVRFRLDVSPACSIGPGKIALLQGIQQSGSLRRAALQLGMSYRRAWLLVDGLNRSFNFTGHDGERGRQGRRRREAHRAGRRSRAALRTAVAQVR